MADLIEYEHPSPGWQAEGVEPGEARKQAGYVAGYKPPAGFFNWFWTGVSRCISELQAKLAGYAGENEADKAEIRAGLAEYTEANEADKEGMRADLVPPGTVDAFAGTEAPEGWALCDGRAVSRTGYAALFEAIGVTWGAGDGSDTFNLPNLGGRMIRGAGAGVPLGSVGGAATHTLTTGEMPRHNHLINLGQPSSGDGVVRPQYAGASGSYVNVNTFDTGSNSAHNNLPPYAALNYIIKY